MSKSNNLKKQRIKTVVENALPEDFSGSPKDRKIFENEPLKLLPNRKLCATKKAPIEIEVPLNEKTAKLPATFCLSNIPIFEEKKCLQSYHFVFSNEQLKQMLEETKIIVDKWHNVFQTSEGIVHRTSFFAVAPHAKQEDGIPMLYRFSITRVLGDEQNHYNISLYALVGGKQDGFLFLGRLDYDNTEPHSFMVSEFSPKFARKHNATLTKGLGSAQRIIRSKFKNPANSNSFNYDMYSIPFPHMHQPNSHYEFGVNPEVVCPKFIKKFVNNNFEQNLSAMLKMFHVSPTPHFRQTNQNIYTIAKEEKKITTLSNHPNPQMLLDEILTLEKQTKKDLYFKSNKQKRIQNAAIQKNPCHKKNKSLKKDAQMSYRSIQKQIQTRQM